MSSWKLKEVEKSANELDQNLYSLGEPAPLFKYSLSNLSKKLVISMTLVKAWLSESRAGSIENERAPLASLLGSRAGERRAYAGQAHWTTVGPGWAWNGQAC